MVVVTLMPSASVSKAIKVYTGLDIKVRKLKLISLISLLITPPMRLHIGHCRPCQFECSHRSNDRQKS